MEKKITEALMELGIPMGNLGFKYIKSALLILEEDPATIDGITKPGGIYHKVAKQFGTMPSRVERAIRHAIEQCFSHCGIDVMQKYFGNTADLDSGKLTNRNFLAALAYTVSDEKPVKYENQKVANNSTVSCSICHDYKIRLIKLEGGCLCIACLHRANLSLSAEEYDQ
jgi:hypothetical protein